MRAQCVVSWIAVVGTLTSWSTRAAVGQQLALAARTPRFFYAPSTAAKPVEIDVRHNAVLGRVVSLHVERATIGALLAEIERQTELTFAYDPHFPATRPVTLEADSITVAAAIGAILVGTGVDVVLTPTGHVWLTESKPHTAGVQEGTIVGRVTDKERGDPIIGATVVLDPARQSATTGIDGRYRFGNLDPGDYTVRARYIGYKSLATSVVVLAGQEVTVDFPLEKSAQQLEQIVTTGTVVPTEVKALPTPVSVISESDIAAQHLVTVQEIFRQAVPSAVSWDQPSFPQQTLFSARGASTLTTGLPQMKLFVDGIEVANPAIGTVDPNSIARIEVIRGPQASAIYGSDAMGGVIQIFTKRGDPSLSRPEVSAEAALGIVQTPYDGYGGVLRQDYTASVRGGAPDLGYNVGAGYSHTADNVPNGEISSQAIPSVYGGVRFARGIVTVEASGRYYNHKSGNYLNPQLATTGFFLWSKPFYQPYQNENQTIGARVSVAPTKWWQHTITVGMDRRVQDLAQSQPRLTTPSDTLLSVESRIESKKSIGFNTSVQSAFGPALAGSLTVGFDHWSLPTALYTTDGALSTTGTIKTAAGQSISGRRTVTNNTGYFAQAQVSLRDVLFLTGGVRAEENSDFGDSLRTPVSPRVGLSYVQRKGGATFKLRGSYGRAIRAPAPGLKLGSTSATSVVLDNPELGPERQEGWDAGVDVVLGSRGSLGVTYYDQIAKGLIQQVLLPGTAIPTFQSQNVGRVENTGVELEGTLGLGPLELKGQYGYTRSRIAELAPGYTGELRVGDQSQFTPKHTAGGSVTFSGLRGTTVGAGLTYVGSWQALDALAFYGCLGGTGPCRPTFRDYTAEYSGFVKVNARVTQQITPMLSGFVSVDNLTNNEAYERWNLIPVRGRISTIGFHFRY